MLCSHGIHKGTEIAYFIYSLENNEIGDIGAKALASGLKALKNLEIVYLCIQLTEIRII
jgi:hypothetical protein